MPRFADESGQAMAEYALIVFALTVGLVAFVPMFIRALQSYYDSFYLMISLPIP